MFDSNSKLWWISSFQSTFFFEKWKMKKITEKKFKRKKWKLILKNFIKLLLKMITLKNLIVDILAPSVEWMINNDYFKIDIQYHKKFQLNDKLKLL